MKFRMLGLVMICISLWRLSGGGNGFIQKGKDLARNAVASVRSIKGGQTMKAVYPTTKEDVTPLFWAKSKANISSRTTAFQGADRNGDYYQDYK